MVVSITSTNGLFPGGSRSAIAKLIQTRFVMLHVWY